MGSSDEQHASVEVGNYGRSLRRWPIWVGAAVVVAVIALTALAVGGGFGGVDDGDDSAPTTDAAPGMRSIEQETALLWASWQRGLAAQECAAERGEDFPAYFPDFDGNYIAVGEFLGVTPDEVGDVRSHIYLVQWPAWYSLSETYGGCLPPFRPVDLSDEDAVSAAIEAARADEGLRARLAADLWEAENPVAYLRHLVDEWVELEQVEPSVDPAALQAVLDEVAAAADEQTAWVQTGTGEIPAGPYAVGFWDQGSLTLQALDDDPARNYGRLHSWGAPPLVARCDGAVIAVGTRPTVLYWFDGRPTELGANPYAGSAPYEIVDLLAELGCERFDAPEPS